MNEKSPLSFITIPFVIGIALGYKFSILPELAFSISIMSISATILAYYNTFHNRQQKRGEILLALIFISFLFLGAYRVSLSPYSQPYLNSKLLKNKNIQKIKLVIKNVANIDRKYSTLECHSYRDNENIILYLKSTTQTSNYYPGDTLILFSKLYPIENFTETFNYKGYKAAQRCFTYTFADSSNHTHIEAKKRSIKDKFSMLRYIHINQLRQQLSHEEWADILIAITTGKKEHLDEQTKTNFQNAGIIHLMAVSGLHTGLIYSYIIILLAILGNIKYVRIIKLLIALILTWLYCGYTGFSDSSVRAAVMISFMTISKITCGKYQFLNSLYASALIILFIKPHTLISVGFQLSYLSMLSIYYIHPAIYSHFTPTNKIKTFFLQLISISLSCQLGTSIITISQFKYIPCYFLISNLVCSPIAAIIIFLTGISFFPGINGKFSYLLIFMIKKAINVIHLTTNTISKMPMNVITIDNTEAMSTALLIISAITTIIILGKKSNCRSYQ